MTEPSVTATHGYIATAENQLTFSEGARIHVIEPEEGGWALGRLDDGTEGWFPYDYVQLDKVEAKKETVSNKTPTKQEAPKKPSKPSKLSAKTENAIHKKTLELEAQKKASELDITKKPYESEVPKKSLPNSPEKAHEIELQKKPLVQEAERKEIDTRTPKTNDEEGVLHGSILLSRQSTEKTLETYLPQRPTKDELLSKNILQDKSGKKPSEKNKEIATTKLEQQGGQGGQGASKSRGGFFSKMINAVRGDNTTAKKTSTPQKQDSTDEASVFGLPLEELVHEKQIPIIVEECVHYLEENGVQEGVFRLSGSRVEIEELKRKFRTPEERPSLSCVKDPNSVAVLLKQFFSQLPEPLFTFDLFDEFSEVVESIPDHKKFGNIPVKEIQSLLTRMPEANQNVTKYLCKFLKDLSIHWEKTKMATSNLALVFGPNLLRSKEVTAGSLFGMDGSKLVEILLLHYDAFFGP
eukprot:TRINITY_DN4996_c0_g1_i1.p1 TRINITY_DN4996_c0_g1~~TRINITY_DN4996_c0_g1_i1.p1  ORF type:complete len:467 (-),score=100.35 TRINITY_DN4996_c0_g1_i1:40-1440(-)